MEWSRQDPSFLSCMGLLLGSKGSDWYDPVNAQWEKGNDETLGAEFKC
jgi:hypothetical protein